MRLTTGMALVLLVVAGLLGSCATAPASREDKAALVAAATSRLQQMSTADPALRVLIQQGYGYAIFPNVDKGGLGVGGAYGRGVVYEQGQHIGYSDLTQGSEPSPHPGTRSLAEGSNRMPNVHPALVTPARTLLGFENDSGTFSVGTRSRPIPRPARLLHTDVLWEDADMADYSRTRWLAPLVLTLWLWGSVPFGRAISDWLRDHGLLQTCIGAAGIILILAFVFFVRRRTPLLSGLRWAMLMGLFSLTVLLMMTVVQTPEERVHFLQIGLLAFLIWRALPQTCGALGWVVLAGILAGAVEEAIQIMVPGRVCDGRDIGMNAVAAVVTGLALWSIQGVASFSTRCVRTHNAEAESDVTLSQNRPL